MPRAVTRTGGHVLMEELSAAGNLGSRGERLFNILGLGVTQLITADVIRPSPGWLMTTPSPQRIAKRDGTGP